MKIIISPAKKINDYNDFSYDLSSINIHPKAIKLYDTLKNLSKEELKKVGATAVLDVKGGIQAIYGAKAVLYKNAINDIMGIDD